MHALLAKEGLTLSKANQQAPVACGEYILYSTAKKWAVLTHFVTSISYFSTSLENPLAKHSPMTFTNVLENL